MLAGLLTSPFACTEFDYQKHTDALGVAGRSSMAGSAQRPAGSGAGQAGDAANANGGEAQDSATASADSGGTGPAAEAAGSSASRNAGGAPATDVGGAGPASGGAATTTAGRAANSGGAGGRSTSVATGGTPTVLAGASTGGALAVAPIPVAPDFRLRLEAEDALLSGGAQIGTSAEASAGRFVDSFNGTLTWSFNVEVDGYYAARLMAAVPGPWGEKLNGLYVNDANVATITTTDQGGSSALYSADPLWISLKKGQNTLSIRPGWGFIRVDYLELTAARNDHATVANTLIDVQASESTRRLMSYLADSYGQKIISGQQGIEYVSTVSDLTGKEPAMVGFDLMDYSPSRVAHGQSSREIENAISWWSERKGIVTFVWHWNAPSKLYDDPGREWWRGFYTTATYFDLEAALADPSSTDYQLLLRDIDAIALQLGRLDAAGVPVLFRPLHEAAGGWFWWGAKGATPYLGLWHLLQDRLMNFHQLHNLIWVWNGQSAAFYPGDDSVDIIGEDVYDGERNYAPDVARFSQALQYTRADKLITLSETGALLDPTRWLASPAIWSWFMVWSGDDFIANEVWNENAMKRAVYTDDSVVTLDELPDLSTYPLP